MFLRDMKLQVLMSGGGSSDGLQYLILLELSRPSRGRDCSAGLEAAPSRVDLRFGKRLTMAGSAHFEQSPEPIVDIAIVDVQTEPVFNIFIAIATDMRPSLRFSALWTRFGYS
jgi:hypothetical protein